MLLTEEEAKTKWCPFARVWAEDDNVISGAWNRGLVEGPKSDALCYGSACMAWRWGKSPPDRRFKVCAETWAETEPERPADVPIDWVWHPADCDDPAGWCEPRSQADARRRGYCGQAGRPE